MDRLDRQESGAGRQCERSRQQAGTKLVSLDFEDHRFSFKRTERLKQQQML
jgi:alpha-D-ribose 1-methylphosphonate 5-phosphate C-P lyase